MITTLFKLNLIILLILLPFTGLSGQIKFEEISFESLIEKSKQENKPVFIFLSNNNNESWWMENNVFNNPAIGEFYNQNFVCGIFYGQINYTNLSSQKLNITKFPSFIFYEPKMEKGYSVLGGHTEDEMITYGKAISNEFKILKVVYHQINPMDSSGTKSNYKIMNNDGRFTLGVNGSRLMYGYPYPNSTSHFVINAGGKMASNSPRFLITRDIEFFDYLEHKNIFARIFKIFKAKKKKIRLKSYQNVSYLSDTLSISFDENNSMHSLITYRFNGLKITQKLSPLNKELDSCKINDTTRYYQVDYMIENESKKPISAGIQVLFDMMIDNNDAAQMDVFTDEILKKAKPEILKNNTAMRGKYAKYDNSDHIKRILVYRDRRLTKNLTGDFRLISEPDEIHIGSWPVFYSILWDIPDIKVGTKYYDSAVLLKWDTDSLNPGSKRYYTTIFGLYNKGILELVPAGTNFTGRSITGNRVKPGKPIFTISPDTIYEGETAVLKWNADNPLNADIYISAKSKMKQRNQGKIIIKPSLTTTYNLQMLDHGKEIANVNANVVVLKRPEKIKIEKISFDGKYTIGTENQSVTFGYPFPYSTSYFQMYYKKQYYSNNSKAADINYLKGMQEENLEKEKRNELSYLSNDFEITQRLIPLNQNYEKTGIDSAVFYQCEYSIKNLKNFKGDYNFRQILDLSSFAKNDLELMVDRKSSKFNITYTNQNIPEEIGINVQSNKSGIKLIPFIHGNEKPKAISIGDWHFLKNMKTEINYSDSNFYKNPAVLINWQKSVLAHDSAKFAFIVGTSQNLKLQYFYNQSEEFKSLSVNFETNKYKVPEDKINEIIEFVKENPFDFMVLEGFSDNRGSLETNYILAEKRINNIKEIIVAKTGIDKNKILNKVHGEFFSNEKSSNQEVDDLDERKVKIVLFKVLK